MVRDNLSLLIAFIYNNWKIIIVSTIGVTLALATVSEINLMAYSYRANLFNDFVHSPIYGGFNPDFDVSIYIDFHGIRPHLKSELQEIIHKSRGLGQTAADNLQLDNFIKNETWHYIVPTSYSALNSNDTNHGLIETVDNDTLQICQNFLSTGRLPQWPNETLFLAEKEVMKKNPIQLGDEILLGRRQNVTAIITGIIEYDYDELWQSSSNNSRAMLWRYFGWSLYQPLFLTIENNFLDFVTAIYYEDLLTFIIQGKIDIHLEQLDAFNYGAEVLQLQRFEQQLLLEISDLEFHQETLADLRYYVHGILERLQGFELFFIATLIVIWLFSLPTLVTTLFLANFSLSLMRRQKQQQIGILKTRGASSRQILNILLGEAGIATLISIGLGSVIGIPLTILVLQDLNALNFTSQVPILILLVNIFQPVLIFGILFNLLLNFRSAFRMAKMEIKESLLPQEKGKPFWKRRYLDVILLSAGLLGILFLILFTDLTLTVEPGSGSDLIISLLWFVAVFFGIPSPILITVGGAMLVARLLPMLLRKAARWTWRVEGGIVAFSFRNILHRLPHASRAALLISIVIAFGVAFISIPYSSDKNLTDSLYYHNLGADMVITEVTDFNESFSLNHTLLNYLQNNLTDVASVSPTLLADIRERFDPNMESFQRIKMLGIDINTYAQTAFFREDFLNQDALSSLSRLNILSAIRAVMQSDFFPDTPDLNTLLSQLQSNTSFLLQEDNLKAAAINVGEQYPLVVTHYNETSEQYTNFRYDLDIVGTFKCWPLFVRYLARPSSDLYLIGNLPTVLEHVNSNLFSIREITINYLISMNSGASKAQIKNQIFNETGFEAESIEDFTDYYLYNPFRDIMVMTINSSLLMLLIVSLFTILMFSFSQLIERNKEIGVERALGMSLHQTSLLFVIEALIIILFGTIMGIILGMVIGQMFLNTTLIAQAYSFPPNIVVYPFDLFAGIAGLILITGLVSSLIPAILATRRQISSILRAE